MSRQQLKEKGFTIIEVVLVLAIAALIFLMVFIALPALQRNQRDTARKQELQKVVAAVTTWQGSHRGNSPASTDIVEFAKYLDPPSPVATGATEIPLTTVTVKFATGTFVGGDGGATTDVVMLGIPASCSDDGTKFADPKSSRQAAAVVKLENGDVAYCQAS